MTGLVRNANARSKGFFIDRAFASPLLRIALTLALAFCGAWVAFAQGAVAAPAAPQGWLQETAHVIVRPLPLLGLLVVGLLLVYWDLLTPTNWDIRGTLGVLCLIAVFVAQIIVGEVGWVGILLLLAGLAGVLLEIHAFPGRGSALAGFVLLFAGMLVSLNSTHNAAFALTVTIFLTLVTGIAFLGFLPKSPAWQRERLRIQQQQAIITPDASVAPLLRPGQIGTALMALRPTGTAEFMGVQAQVLSETGFLEPGATVRIERIEGDHIVVAPVTETVEASLGILS